MKRETRVLVFFLPGKRGGVTTYNKCTYICTYAHNIKTSAANIAISRQVWPFKAG